MRSARLFARGFHGTSSLHPARTALLLPSWTLVGHAQRRWSSAEDKEVDALVSQLKASVSNTPASRFRSKNQQRNHKPEHPTGGQGQDHPSLASLRAFAKSEAEVLMLPGLTPAERFRIHHECKSLGLTSATDATTKAVKVTRVRESKHGSSPPQQQAAKDHKEDQQPSAPVRPVPPQQPPLTPASSNSALPAEAEQAAKAPPLHTASGQPKTVMQLTSQIDAVTVELRQTLEQLAQLRAKPAANGLNARQLRSVAEPDSAFEELASADLDSNAFVPQLSQPLSTQEIVVDAALEAASSMPVVVTRRRHVALATVVGVVSSAIETARDEENAADVATFTIAVDHPLISDPTARRLEFEVRSYSSKLSQFCIRQMRQGDVVHILGHVLPDNSASKTVVVLTDEGCHASVVIGKETATAAS